MGYKTKSMLHLYSADREKTKENNKNTPAAKGSYSNPGSNLFPAYKPKVTAATSVGGSDAAQLGNVAAQLASKLIGSGAGRSTSNFDRKIEAKKEKGNLAGSARAERREAKWDYRQKKRAAKTLAKTEGTYLSKRKEKKRVEGLGAFDRETYDMEQSVKPTRSESIASELKENQLRRLNAAKEETKPKGDTGSSVTNITNTGTGVFNEKTRFKLGSSLNLENWGKELVPLKPDLNKNNSFEAITPKVNVDDPGEGAVPPTEKLIEQKPTANAATENSKEKPRLFPEGVGTGAVNSKEKPRLFPEGVGTGAVKGSGTAKAKKVTENLNPEYYHKDGTPKYKVETNKKTGEEYVIRNPSPASRAVTGIITGATGAFSRALTAPFSPEAIAERKAKLEQAKQKNKQLQEDNKLDLKKIKQIQGLPMMGDGFNEGMSRKNKYKK